MSVGTNISVFPNRDMVVAVGYEEGEELTVEVLRGDVVIGTTRGPAVETPEGIGLEVNHGPLGAPLPGDCWTGFTPDIVGGDVIRVTNSKGEVDTMTVQDQAFVGQPYLDANNNVAVDGTGVQGRSDFAVEFRRDKPTPRLRQGPFAPVWTSPTTWTATWRVPTAGVSGLTPEQARNIALNEAAWLAVADITTETTLAELGEPGGVGPGCTGSADPNNLVEPKPVNIASGDFSLTGTARPGVVSVEVTIGDLPAKTAQVSANRTWTLPVTKAELAALPDGYVTIASTFVDASTVDEAGAEVPGPRVAGADVLMLKDTVAPAAPTASPDGGTYSGAQAVTLDKGDNEDTSKIRYRVGTSTVTDPTVASPEATGQISVSASQTLKARVVDVAGNLGAVGTFTYRIGTPPATPTGVTGVEVLGGIRLGWISVGGATGYNVYRDGSSTPVNGTTPVTPTSYTDRGLAEGQYSYTVRAVEANGIESGTSDVATATFAAPAVPTGLTATPADRQNRLTWTRNTEADLAGYELTREGAAAVKVAETQGAYTDSGLTNGTTYSYSLVALDAAGNRSAPSGSVQGTPVNVAPNITARAPGVNATTVAVGSNVTATFSEAVTGVSNTTFTVRAGTAAPVAAAVSYDAASGVATLNPSANLAADTRYTVTLAGGASAIRDSGGAPLANTTWTFLTGAAPTVSTRTPAANATGQSVSGNVTATFSEPVAGVSGTTFTLKNAAGTTVAGSVSYNATTRVATLNPTANLVSNSTYTATLGTGIRDGAGNPLATTSWSFLVGTAPTVTARTPAVNATGASRTGNITATFSEAVTGYSTTTATLKNATTGAVITAAVTYNATTRVLSINPSPTLGASTKYTVTLTGGRTAIRDTAGNALATATWSFTTGR